MIRINKITVKKKEDNLRYYLVFQEVLKVKNKLRERYEEVFRNSQH